MVHEAFHSSKRHWQQMDPPQACVTMRAYEDANARL